MHSAEDRAETSKPPTQMSTSNYVPSRSLVGRSILAVGMIIGFYVLAIGAALGLLYLPFAAIYLVHIASCYLAIPCVAGAFTILWAILPRPDRFTPPGPRLDPQTHPKLFETIKDVADRTGEEMPAEVYLIRRVNAFVTQRGGIMGIGSKRVMGIGLPLMQVLTVDQFRAVVAHEFGHYYGGDLKLAPWLYQTRGAMGRAIHALAARHSAFFLPFMEYGKLFMLVTQNISRRQEFVADELAARITGSENMVSSLRAIHGGAVAFSAYWSDEVATKLHAGYRPAMIEGFSYFIGRGADSDAFQRHVDSEVKEGKTDPFDSHPTLRERIDAIEQARTASPGEATSLNSAGTTALSLLNNTYQLETDLLAQVCGSSKAGVLKPVTWETLGKDTTLADYAELVRQHTHALKGLTATDLPRTTGNLEGFCMKLVPTGADLSPDDMPYAFRLAKKTLGGALLMVLQKAGWQVNLPASGEAYCEREGVRIEPFAVIHQLSWGKLRSEEWKKQCADAGIANLDLGEVNPHADIAL